MQIKMPTYLRLVMLRQGMLKTLHNLVLVMFTEHSKSIDSRVLFTQETVQNHPTIKEALVPIKQIKNSIRAYKRYKT